MTTATLLQTHQLFYRTQDGRADYVFSFEEQVDGTWLPFIVSQPSYNGRDTGLHATHRLTRGDRYYVCWTKALESLADAKEVAALWADQTQIYISTGREFG